MDVPRRPARGCRAVLCLTARVGNNGADGRHRGRASRLRARDRWGDAYRLLSALELDDLHIDDLDRIATAAYLTGHDEEGFGYWVRAHQACLDNGAIHRALYFGRASGKDSASRATSSVAAAGWSAVRAC